MTLGQIMVVVGVDTSQVRAGLSSAVGQAAAQGSRAGQAFGSGFSSSMGRFMRIGGQASALMFNLRELSQAFIGVTGVGVAAEYGRYRRQLLGISGDARVAGDSFRTLRDIAADTNFDTQQVIGLGVNIAGRTGDVAGATQDVKNIVDAATVMGVGNESWDRFQTNLLQMQNYGDRKVSVVDLRQMRNYAPMLSTAVSKALGITVSEASDRIEKMSGKELYDLIQQVGERNRGAAAAASGADALAVAANVMDDLRNAIEPTGRVVNAVLVPALTAVRFVVQSFGRVNEMTGGIAGLAGLATAGGIAFAVMRGSISRAFFSVTALTTAINNLAAASGRAAASTVVQGGVGSIADLFGGAGGKGRGGVRAGGMGRAFGQLGRFAGVAAKIGRIATMALPLIAELGLSYFAGQAGERGDKRRANMLSGAAAGVGWGSLIGSILGGIVGSVLLPGLGTAAGATLGGIAGGAVGGGIGGYLGNRQTVDAAGPSFGARIDPMKANTDAINNLADSLMEITKFSAIGGGDRTKGALAGAELDAQAYLLRSMAGNFG